jgi:hypothetical protein
MRQSFLMVTVCHGDFHPANVLLSKMPALTGLRRAGSACRRADIHHWQERKAPDTHPFLKVFVKVSFRLSKALFRLRRRGRRIRRWL